MELNENDAEVYMNGILDKTDAMLELKEKKRAPREAAVITDMLSATKNQGSERHGEESLVELALLEGSSQDNRTPAKENGGPTIKASVNDTEHLHHVEAQKEQREDSEANQPLATLGMATLGMVAEDIVETKDIVDTEQKTSLRRKIPRGEHEKSKVTVQKISA